MLWAEGTTRFKIGFTRESTADKRALQLMASSPFPLRIIATKAGTTRDEQEAHFLAHAFRTHGEWFALPEAAVWWLLRWFGVALPEGITLGEPHHG